MRNELSEQTSKLLSTEAELSPELAAHPHLHLQWGLRNNVGSKVAKPPLSPVPAHRSRQPSSSWQKQSRAIMQTGLGAPR